MSFPANLSFPRPRNEELSYVREMVVRLVLGGEVDGFLVVPVGRPSVKQFLYSNVYNCLFTSFLTTCSILNYVMQYYLKQGVGLGIRIGRKSDFYPPDISPRLVLY